MPNRWLIGIGALALVTAAAVAIWFASNHHQPEITSTAASHPATRPAQTPVIAANTVLHADLPYGGPDATLNRLDIYAPKDATHAPVLIFVHGGEWSRGDKKDVSCKPKFLNEQGIVFVSVNYRLSPRDKHPAQVDDIATAIAWLSEHIAEFGGDPEKLVLMGHSAGCHLVTLVSLDPAYLAKVHLTPAALRGAVAWSGGMYDLAARAKAGGMYPPYIKATFGEGEEAQHAASPLAHAAKAAHSPPFLIVSVDDEKSASSRQASQKLLEAINATGGKARPVLLKGKTHFTANHELGAPGDASGTTLLDFINEVTK